MENMEEQIKNVIHKLRPYLQRDGGDIAFHSFENGIVYVDMLGACDGCAMIGDTIEAGVGILLKEEVPGVIDVKLASSKNQMDDFRFENKEEQ